MQNTQGHMVRNASAGKPVVLGSSFSGVLVSLALSKAGVDHVLIGGDEPPEIPRLGESLNECASPDLFCDLGREFPQYFYTKSHISLLNGDVASQIQIANPRRCKERMSQTLPRPDSVWPLRTFWHCATGRNLMHVDRIRLDRALYHKALAQPQCEFVKLLVQQVDVGADDRVTRLVLDDGSEIREPRFVFDNTGFRGLVARAAGVGVQPLSNEQRVVWTHYERAAEDDCPQRWWRQGTNLLLLEREPDGMDGIAWLIPLGSTVSVGVSVDNDRFGEATLDGEQVMRLLNEAFARRGVDYPTLFPDRRRPIMQLTHRYYVRDRACGANWLLVGGTYMSVWFPTSGGLWTVTAALRLIPRIMDEPESMGARYEEVLQSLLVFHDNLEKMIHGRPFCTNQEAYLFWSKWLSGFVWRMGHYLGLLSAVRNRRFERYQPFIWAAAWFRKLPAVQMIVWGFVVTRSRKPTDRRQQADSFDGYFHQTRFRVRNYLLGYLTWLGLRQD